MPKMSVIAMFVNLRRWFDTLHDRHGSRILLKRQEVFMRMQRQQSQWHGPLVEGRPVRFALVNDPCRNFLRGCTSPIASPVTNEEWRML